MDDNSIRSRFMKLDSPSLCDASPLVRALGPGLLPVNPNLTMAGRARTVRCSNDYLTVIKALTEACEGEVLVIDGSGQNQAVFGELLAAEAKRKGLAGVVVDGAIHHLKGIVEIEFPVYYRFTNPRAGRADVIEPPTDVVSVCGVTVATGDWVFGDSDGVVVIPEAQVEAILSVADEIEKVDKKVFESVKGGEALTRIMKFEEFCREHDREIRTRLDYQLSEK